MPVKIEILMLRKKFGIIGKEIFFFLILKIIFLIFLVKLLDYRIDLVSIPYFYLHFIIG